tara:strand:+ start:12039 stop:12776 length:738 start_codon:yes stop_codon:yes gene_type:complete
MTDAVILAGGFGTRLRSVVADVPKPLAPVNGRPFLDHQLAWLARGGVTRAIIAAHHLADQIIRFAEDRDGHPLPITVVREDAPLGTGGAVKNAITAARVQGTAIVLNGDTYYRFGLTELTSAHAQSNNPIIMAVAPMNNCARYGTVDVTDGQVTRFVQAAGEQISGLVNCGVYAMDATAMTTAPDGAFSMEHDFFPRMAAAGHLGAHIVRSASVGKSACGVEQTAFLDFGTPESYATINRELSEQ